MKYPLEDVRIQELVQLIDDGCTYAEIGKKYGATESGVSSKINRFRRDAEIVRPDDSMPPSKRDRILEFLEHHPEIETFTAKSLQVLTGLPWCSPPLSGLGKDGTLTFERKLASDGVTFYHEYSNPFTNNPAPPKTQQSVQQVIEPERTPDFGFIWRECVNLKRGIVGISGYAHYVLMHLPIFNIMPEKHFIRAKKKWDNLYPGVPAPFDVDAVQEEEVDSREKPDEGVGQVLERLFVLEKTTREMMRLLGQRMEIIEDEFSALKNDVGPHEPPVEVDFAKSQLLEVALKLLNRALQ